MKNFIINLLFKLLKQETKTPYNIQNIFGVKSNHKVRQEKWERALIRLWKDKDLIDYLFYQSESDKEKIFQGKVTTDLLRGARLRTLYIVYQANRAYLLSVKSEKLKEVDKSYQQICKIEK